MSKTLLPVLLFVCMLTIGSAPLSAQEPAPSPGDLILHPGDMITWSPKPPHRVRFGGTVTHNDAQLTLTSFDDVKTVLEIDPPPLTIESGGFARAGTGKPVSAKVKVGAAASGVPEFFFTCGFDPHVGIMVTVPFKIMPSDGQQARDVQIESALGPPRWILKTPQGDKKLTRP
jgi:hypothetical protein